MFFIHSGKIKMKCDLNELIEEDEIFERVNDYEKLLIEAQTKVNSIDMHLEKPSVKTLIGYSESGYCGDVDIFAEIK